MIEKKHPDYDIVVSEDGVIRSLKTGKIFKQNINEFGYVIVSVPSGEKGKTLKRRVHRLVAQTFIDNPENKREVNHIDGNKLNNCVVNLEWVTSQENKDHAWENGLYSAIGENHHDAIHSESFIRKICELIQDGWRNKEIAETTGLHKDYISDIRTGRRWQSISGDYNLSFTRKDRLSKEKVVYIAELLENGSPVKVVAETTRASRRQVERIKKRQTHSQLTKHYNF